MAITNFIPTVWSETLQQSLDKRHIAVAHCNREFEGDITEKGNTVRICGLQNVKIYDYVKNSDMKIPETLEDFSTNLTIDQAKYFNFQIDDIDRAQASPKLMELAMANAANMLADEADKAVFNRLCEDQEMLDYIEVSSSNILEHFINARTQLYNQNVMNNEDVVIEVSPDIAELIVKAKLNTLSDNTDTLENGYLGCIMGCKIYVSKNIPTVTRDDNPDIRVSRCVIRTKRAVAFAEQLSEIQAYRPERRFADAVKGLYLFGCKVVYPNECKILDFGINTAF